MRIGVLTYHCIPNFGAQLQALSTVGYLKTNGHEPIVLNWYPEDLENYYLERVPIEQNKIQFDFAQKNMPVSHLCRTMTQLAEEMQLLGLDRIILGSDALFDYTPEKDRYNFSYRKLKRIPLSITSNHMLPNPFWGCFNDFLNEDVPTYGYAISSQNMPYFHLNSIEKKEIRRLLDRFNLITVRDEWTQDIVKSLSHHKTVPIVPDPVFALNQNVTDIPSKEEIIRKYNLPDNYCLISFLHNVLPDKFINRLIEILETDCNRKCVSFPMPEGLKVYKTQYTIQLPLSPIDWYALIKYSNGYIGERMHPIVVCLHNAIPFYCFDQYGTNKVIIPRLWNKFMPESSKIYDIICRAKLSENISFYSKTKDLTPQDVANKLMAFDIKACKLFSKQQLHAYNTSMLNLVS